MENPKKPSKNRFVAYVQKTCSLALKALIWAGVCAALNIGLLYFCQLLFGFYLKTPMGPEFIASNPELMGMIQQLSDMGYEQLTIPITLTAFVICLGILAACKLFFLARYISPMGIIGRAIMCVLPICAVVATVMPEFVPVGSWAMAYGLSIFPTLVMFNISFTIADELLPEVDELIAVFQKNEKPGTSSNVRR